MALPHLIIGNKNYSSWSFRPWLAMRVSGIDFTEEVVPLSTPDTKTRISEHSRAGRVPILKDNGIVVWESLAIIEYLAERFPDARLWPADMQARALARSISNEMHAGFQALRSSCPMNMRRPRRRLDISADAAANVRRIDEMWQDCRETYGAAGPFLSGRSAPPMRCMRRWSIASMSMIFPCRGRPRPIWRRSRRCPPIANGRRRSPGGLGHRP